MQTMAELKRRHKRIRKLAREGLHRKGIALESGLSLYVVRYHLVGTCRCWRWSYIGRPRAAPAGGAA